jgi:hypothetical protein
MYYKEANISIKFSCMRRNLTHGLGLINSVACNLFQSKAPLMWREKIETLQTTKTYLTIILKFYKNDN